MSTFSDYQREEEPRIQPSDYRVAVVSAEEKMSSKNNPMIAIELCPSGSNLKVCHYIVKGEYFNRNMTKFFDSFDITEGDFDFLGWRGAMGAARLKEDENGYLKVRYFIKKSDAEKLPPWEGVLPERNTVTDLSVDISEEDLPF